MTVNIVGAGIGGLTAALALHAAGRHCHLFEQARRPHCLSEGIILLPAAVAALSELDLLDEIEAAGVKIGSLMFATGFGGTVPRASRGSDDGIGTPLISICRARLLQILNRAAWHRLGPAHLHWGCRLEAIEQVRGGVVARFRDRSTDGCFARTASCLVGADGINSATLGLIDPAGSPASWSGLTLCQGTTEWPTWRDGQTMLVANGRHAKLMLQPITRQCSKADHRVISWAAIMRIGGSDFSAIARAGPSSPPVLAERTELEERLRREFRIDWLDVRGLIRRTNEIIQFPVMDRQPVDRRTRGRVTLLGDAAHGRCQSDFGGATNAILDAVCLAQWFHLSTPYAALRGYAAERRLAAQKVTAASHRPALSDRIIDLGDAPIPCGDWERFKGY